MKIVFFELIDQLEEFYINEIFKIRVDTDNDNSNKVNQLKRIRKNCQGFKLFLPEKLADNSIRILNNK